MTQPKRVRNQISWNLKPPAEQVSIFRRLNQGLINQRCSSRFQEPHWSLFQVHTWKFPPFLVLEIQRPCRPSWKSKIYLYAKLAAGSAPGDVGEGDWKSSMKSGRNHRALLALGWTWSCWGDPQSQVSPFLEVANWRNIVSLLCLLGALITTNLVLQQLFEVYSLQDVSPIPKRPLRHSSTRISFFFILSTHVKAALSSHKYSPPPPPFSLSLNNTEDWPESPLVWRFSRLGRKVFKRKKQDFVRQHKHGVSDVNFWEAPGILVEGKPITMC